MGWKVNLLSCAAATVAVLIVTPLLLRVFGLMVIVSQQDESRQELESYRVVLHEPVSLETICAITIIKSILLIFPMLSPSFFCQIIMLL